MANMNFSAKEAAYQGSTVGGQISRNPMPSDNRAIEISLSQLSSGIKCLEDNIHELICRLGPAMRQETAGEVSKVAQMIPSVTVLSGDIDSHTSSIQSLAEKTRTILNLLEI